MSSLGNSHPEIENKDSSSSSIARSTCDTQQHENDNRLKKIAFEDAALMISEHYDKLEKIISDDEKLSLYGLYKRITVGNSPLDSRPSVFYPTARAKYNAWFSRNDMSIETAQVQYINIASVVLDRIGVTINNPMPSIVSLATSPSPDSSLPTSSSSSESDMSETSPLIGFRSKSTNNDHNSSPCHKPLIDILPRGQIDISYSDLCFGLCKCLSHACSPLPSKSSRQNYENRIAHLWEKRGHYSHNERVLVSQSVRSAFDLYLQARNFPRGSEIIMSAIQIEGMVRIASEAHGLKIVPVDCSPESVSPSISDILSKINDRTVAVMIVHAFGAIGDINFEELSQPLKDSHIDLIEDCAECYSGLQISKDFEPYLGHVSSDIVFFSFGTIKTATALGGGISLVRDIELYSQIKRIQDRYDDISSTQFIWKILKTFILVFLCKSPLLFGALIRVLQLVGLQYEHIITSSLRGFTITEDKSHCEQLIPMIRRKISLGNMALLERRLSRYNGKYVFERIKRAEDLANAIQQYAPNITVPGHMCRRHLYWLFPIIVDYPDKISAELIKYGYDIPRGTSQLGPITRYAKVDNQCPSASSLMTSLLYVPIASTSMTRSEIVNIAKVLGKVTNKTYETSHRDSGYKISSRSIFIVLLLLNIRSFVSKIISAFALWYMLCVVILLVLRWFRYKSYHDISTVAFSRYVRNSASQEIDSEQIRRKENQLSSEPVDNTVFEDVVETSTRALLTGATGFVGSVMLRDLLLLRKSLGILGGVVLLTRAKGTTTARQRIDKLLSQEMFSFLSKDEKRTMVLVIEGDIMLPQFGMTNDDFDYLHELYITHVFHCAASVKFNQPIEDAAMSNIGPSLQLQKLSKDLNARYIYMSTSFVHGNLSGSINNPLSEAIFPLEKYNALDIYHSMMGTQALASTAMSDLGFPNTYTFSKCVCEHLLLLDKESDIVIIRPCIVGPAWVSPYQGWAGEVPSTIVAGACLFLKNPFSIWSFGPSNAPIIPVDIVSKFALSVGFITEIRIDNPVDSKKLYFTQRKTVSVNSQRRQIYNATWDATSTLKTQFTWMDFSLATIQLGSVCCYYSRFWAQLYQWLMTTFVWRKNISYEYFYSIHSLFVKIPYRIYLWVQKGFNPERAKATERMSTIIDLPLLFFPFTQASFYFKSDIVCPENFNAQEYMMDCIMAADQILLNMKKTQKRRDFERFMIAGKHHNPVYSDFWMSLTQPYGSCIIRVIGFFLGHLIRRVCTELTVDLPSFSALARIKGTYGQNAFIVLAPTHRSLFDFLLISYMCFVLPEMGIDIPVICAAEEFYHLPVFGWLAYAAGAFFIRRGKGEDPNLACQVSTLKRKGVSTFEVFIEGSRSRDRRFLCPKAGFLRCLSNTGGTHIIVPISISYERVPEQDIFVDEIDNCRKKGLVLDNFCDWLKNVFLDRVNIGRIHISAATPEILRPDSNIHKLASTIQIAHQKKMLVSSYHIEATSRAIGIDSSVVLKAMRDLKCNLWDKPSEKSVEIIPLPTNRIELETVMVHWMYHLAPFYVKTRPDWARWLNPQVTSTSSSESSNSVSALVEAFSGIFDTAEIQVKTTVKRIRNLGYKRLTKRHIIQYSGISKMSKYALFHTAATEIWVQNNASNPKPDCSQKNCSTLMNSYFQHIKTKNVIENGENFGYWGYKDSGFIARTGRGGKYYVIMKGDRYNISGRVLRNLVPFLENQMNIRLNFIQPTLPSIIPDLNLPSCAISAADLQNLEQITTCQVSNLPHDRCRHGTGHTQEDMFLLRTGNVQNRRFPDAVVWPQNDFDVDTLVCFASKKNWCLMPFGGGTNVTHATWCPPKDIEPRPIVSVDMKCMDKILFVNKEDGIAHVQAGITGVNLIKELKKYGVTMGHEPDSLEFSTLGGWIATKASGMKRSKYGNIEDIVNDITVIGSNCRFHKDGLSNSDKKSIDKNKVTGRISAGIDFCPLVFGSEGCMGIITSAKIKVFPIPEKIVYECVLFPTFEDGFNFVKDVASMRQFKPASIRLVDNEQFRLGQVLKGDEMTFMKRAQVSIVKPLLSKLYNLQKETTVSVSITFEGSKVEVRFQQSMIKKLAQKYGGLLVGEDAGKAGYDLTFAIAYLRDFAMNYGCLGESFETFVPWSKVESLITATKNLIIEEHTKRCLIGKPLVSCRITQLYDDGVCVYFYYLMNYTGIENPSEVYSDIEKAAREEILQQGGSLSHHHGVGKIRGRWMHTVHSEEVRSLLKDLKKSIDPSNTFGARNGTFYE